jgi:D-sedoheptulose 7-phosphate isomerase
MKSASALLKANLLDSINAKQAMLERVEDLAIFERAADEVVRRYRNGGRLYIAGNGGSAADAQHLAAEFVSKLARDRAPLAAEALTVDSSILTAIGNDYGFEEVFARQVAGKATAKDIFLGITTSGNSPNIVLALQKCRELNVPTIVFTGHQGGRVRSLADYCVIAAGATTATIQEVHIVLAHTLCECVERALFEAGSTSTISGATA